LLDVKVYVYFGDLARADAIEEEGNRLDPLARLGPLLPVSSYLKTIGHQQSRD